MNIQRIFDVLEKDRDNARLGIVCAELEEQGYKVRLAGRPVDSSGIYGGGHKDLEYKPGPLNVAIYKGGSLDQEFSLEFVGYQEVVIGKKVT